MEIGAPIAAAVLLAGVAGQAFLILAMLRRHGELSVRMAALEARPDLDPRILAALEAAGLPAGLEAPAFRLPDVEGDSVTLASLLARGRPTMLVFSAPGCAPCTALLPEVGRWQREHGSALTIAVVSVGDLDENRARAREWGLEDVLVQREVEVLSAYKGVLMPSAVIVALAGRIASPLVGGPDRIRRLLDAAVHGDADPGRSDLRKD
jgi:thiol-disulfide isomerase/thioredoxin